MIATATVLDRAAKVLSYPDEGWRDELQELVRAAPPGPRMHLERALAQLGSLGTGDLEELYARTFDLSPACTLDLGWHIWGEAYDRGAFLVELARLLREHGLEPGAELPDHLPTVLRLLGRLEPARAAALVRERVLPALGAIERGLGDAPHAALVHAVRELIAKEGGEP